MASLTVEPHLIVLQIIKMELHLVMMDYRASVQIQKACSRKVYIKTIAIALTQLCTLLTQPRTHASAKTVVLNLSQEYAYHNSSANNLAAQYTNI